MVLIPQIYCGWINLSTSVSCLYELCLPSNSCHIAKILRGHFQKWSLRYVPYVRLRNEYIKILLTTVSALAYTVPVRRIVAAN